MKTGVHPMQVQLRLFLDWGIRFKKPSSGKDQRMTCEPFQFDPQL